MNKISKPIYDDLVKGLTLLEADLISAEWDDKFEHVRKLSEYDHGYTFIVTSED